jgi:hypothetical protein
MHLSKLTTTLKALDKPVFDRLRDYIQSPYFKVSSPAASLFTYLEKHYPKFPENKIQPQSIAKKCPLLYDENKQAKAGTQLQKHVEHFLTLEKWATQTNTHPHYLLQTQMQLNLHDSFNSSFKKYKQQLEECAEKNIDYFYNKHTFTELEFNGFHARLQRNPQNDLTPVLKTLDEFYAIKKLRYQCELLSRHQILGTPYSDDNIDSIIQTLQPHTNEQYPYVYLFANTFLMLRKTNFEDCLIHYRHIHDFVSQRLEAKISQGIKECIYYVINHCLHWNNKGYEAAGTNALWWYELKINKDLLIENGLLQPSDFRNIVSLAIINNKNEKWLKQFIDNYHMYLPAEHQPTNTAFAQAQYLYYTKKYGLAMPLFQQAQAKEEPIFNMIVRRWQFICMYEQNPDNKDLLLDFVIAWERQLHRTAPSLHQLKPVFGKVISYSKKLLQSNDKETRKKIIASLNAEDFFAGKPWLLKQLQE